MSKFKKGDKVKRKKSELNFFLDRQKHYNVPISDIKDIAIVTKVDHNYNYVYLKTLTGVDIKDWDITKFELYEENNQQLKVGDKARVRNDLPEDYTYLAGTETYGMGNKQKMLGKIITIKEVKDNYYIIKEDDNYYIDDMLELVSEEQQLKVGDKVEIIDYLTKDRNDYKHFFCYDMDNYFSKVATIVGVLNYDDYELDIDNGMYSWSKDMFKKINKIERKTESLKEEEKMEKLGLVNLYYDKKVEEISSRFNAEIKQIESKGIPALVLKDAILKDAEEQLNELYISQFSEEELKDYAAGKIVDMSNKPLTRRSIDITISTNLSLNSGYVNEDIELLKKEKEAELKTLNDLITEVKAHLELASTKDEVEEILISYKIINNKSKQLI